MTKLLLVLCGGAIGTVMRYLLSTNINNYFSSLAIWGTLAVNLIGAFAIGVVWGMFQDKPGATNMILLVATGILGGFTTFSAFAFEVHNLFKVGNVKMAIAYILITNIVGIALAIFGYKLFSSVGS